MKFKKRGNPRYTQISVYVIVTVIVIYILIKIANHAGDIFSAAGTGLHRMGIVLKPLAGGFVLAYLLHPLADRLERRLDKGRAGRLDKGRAGRLGRESDKGPANRPLPLNRKDPEHKGVLLPEEVGSVPGGTGAAAGAEAASGKRVKSHRSLAVALTFLIVFGILVIAFSIIISVISSQARMISFDDITDFISSISSSLKDVYSGILSVLKRLNIDSADLNNVIQSVGSKAAGLALSLSRNLLNSLSQMTSFFTNLLFAVIFAVYFLLDSRNLEKYWDKVLKAVSTKRFYDGVHRFITDMDVVFSGYIRGQLMDACLMCVLISVALSIVGVKFAILIGILTGIGNLIPYVGPVVAYVSTILACLLQQDWKLLVVACIVILVIQLIDGNIINPKLLSSTVNVHPMLVIVALIAGGAIGGFLGMLLAVPVAALIKLYFDRIVDFLIRRRYLEKEQNGPVTEPGSDAGCGTGDE